MQRLPILRSGAFGLHSEAREGGRYFRFEETVVKVVESLVPTAVTAPIMTTAISAAIRPYSIAVAPDSSRTKRANICIEISSIRLSSATCLGPCATNVVREV